MTLCWGSHVESCPDAPLQAYIRSVGCDSC